MKRFVVTATLAVALGLWSSGRADAQIIYGYSVPTVNGTMMTNGPILMSSGPGMFNTFSPPLRGVMLQPSVNPNFGTPFGFNQVNRFSGMGFNNSFFQPNTFGNPYFGNPFYGNPSAGFNRNMSFMPMGMGMGMGMGRGRW
jgi:hypothetical protein